MRVSMSVIFLYGFPFFFPFAQAQVKVEAVGGSVWRVRWKRFNEDEEAYYSGVGIVVWVLGSNESINRLTLARKFQYRWI